MKCDFFTTNAFDAGNDIRNLDRSPVMCPEGQGLSSWKLNTGDGANRKLSYKCCDIPQYDETKSRCVVAETGCTAQGRLEYLDRHKPDCGEGMVMTGWTMANCGGSNAQVSYRCCPIATASAASSSAAVAAIGRGRGGVVVASSPAGANAPPFAAVALMGAPAYDSPWCLYPLYDWYNGEDGSRGFFKNDKGIRAFKRYKASCASHANPNAVMAGWRLEMCQSTLDPGDNEQLSHQGGYTGKVGGDLVPACFEPPAGTQTQMAGTCTTHYSTPSAFQGGGLKDLVGRCSLTPG